MKKLIKQSKEKNLDVFEKIMDLYSAQVYYIIKRIVGQVASDEEIEEMVSNVFVRVWNQIEQYDETSGNIETLIFLKARTQALTFKRQNKSQANDKDLNQGLEQTPLRDSMSLFSTIENKSLIKLKQQLDDLMEPDKTYFFMRYFLYYDLNTIANTFKCSVTVVESSLYRSRNQLKHNFKKEGYYE
ncbi:MAG: sigma-70 family RNA polymerase sigma factor [Turicibacter sp.]